MQIKDFIKDEIDCFRQRCNFVNDEIELFNKRASGCTLDEIAEQLNISIDSARKLSVKVNKKIEKVIKLMAQK